jgi:hypothetical protein
MKYQRMIILMFRTEILPDINFPIYNQFSALWYTLLSTSLVWHPACFLTRKSNLY